MKRAFSLVLALALMLTLPGCGQANPDSPGGSEPSMSSPAGNGTDPSTVTTAPPETTAPLLALETAVSGGEPVSWPIAEGSGYLIDVTASGDWSVSLPVGDDFRLSDLEAIGFCNEHLEPVAGQAECTLRNGVLRISSEADAATAGPVYLILVSQALTPGKTALFQYSEQESVRTSLRKIRALTGETVFCYAKSAFSEGYCWAQLQYTDSGKPFIGILDTRGQLVAEHTDWELTDYGEFHNGVSLVRDSGDICSFINTKGEVLFRSDDPEYHDFIKGIFPGGYLFLERTEASLTSKKNYYAIMDCYGNFVLDWTEYNGYYLFNYLGGHVFAFLNQFKRGDYDTIRFYNAETGVWTKVSNMDGGSLWRLPELVAEHSDGWVIIGQGRERTMGNCVLVSTKDGRIYDLEGEYEYGMPGNGRIAILQTGPYEDRFDGIGYFDTATATCKMLSYEYMGLARRPEKIHENLRYESHVELGLWPAYNAPGLFQHDPRSNQSTYIFDAEFSNGVMLLQLKGADGFDYYALMNDAGENVIEPVKGTAVDTLGCGRFLVMRDGVYHVLDESGSEVTILPDRQAGDIISVSPYQDGLARVTTNMSRDCFIDPDGNYVFGVDSPVRKAEAVQVYGLTPSAETTESEKIPADAFVYRYDTVEITTRDGSRTRADGVVIVGYRDAGDVVMIPREIDGLPVLKIGASAFAGSHIRELRFAGDISVIEAFAFADCEKLSVVELPDCPMTLGSLCFTGCTALPRLEIPASCVFARGEVWNETLGIYEYFPEGPVSQEDSTAVVTRDR